MLHALVFRVFFLFAFLIFFFNLYFYYGEMLAQKREALLL